MEQEIIVARPIKISNTRPPLQPKQERFVKLYIQQNLSAVQAYAIAYNLDPDDTRQYQVCCAGAGRLKKNKQVVARMNEMLNLEDFTDEGVDKQLNHLIKQHDNPSLKLGAIKEYNALRKRTGQGGQKAVFKGNTFNLTNLLDQAAQEE